MVDSLALIVSSRVHELHGLGLAEFVGLIQVRSVRPRACSVR